MTAIHEDTTIREAAGTDLVPLPPGSHLLQPIMRWANDAPDRPIVVVPARRRVRRRQPPATSTGGSGRLPRGSSPAASSRGDRVVLMSHTRLEWLLLDYAILAAGGVTVPAYETSSAEQLAVDRERQRSGRRRSLETPAMATMLRASPPSTRRVVPRRRSSSTRAGSTSSTAVGATSTTRSSTRGSRRSRPTDWRRSSTRRARRAGRRAASLTHGNLRTNVLQNIDAVRSMLEPRRGHAAVPAARPHADQDHRARRHGVGHQARLRHRRRPSAGGAGAGAPDDARRRAPGVREGVQRRAAQGRRRRPRADLRQGRRGGHRWSEAHATGTSRPITERRARGARSARVPQAASRVRRPAAVRRSAAAARSANGSRTSSTASASRSSRAMASPRRARP